MHETSRDLMELLIIGRLAPFFWLFVVGGIVVPIVLIALPQTSNVTGITVAALAVVLGMWLKRFLIVVPGLAEPLMPTELTIYWPSQGEIASTVGGGPRRLRGRGPRDGRWSRQSGNAGAGAAAAGAAGRRPAERDPRRKAARRAGRGAGRRGGAVPTA